MSPAASFNLDAYLDRIGYTGPRTPTASVLAEIQFRHVCTIPFENLDLHLGRGIRIDLASIERKLVHDRRGGYCFEHNTLLGAALTALGFVVTPLAARVRWQVPADIETALTHMILLVEAEGQRFLADGGFGSGSLSAALLLDTEAEQTTPHDVRRLVREGSAFSHRIKLSDEWAEVYRFTLQPTLTVDYEMANWFTSTWPQSRFRLNLTAALTSPDRRASLLNREFTLRFNDGRVEKRQLETPDELLSVLANHFGLSFPAGTRFGSPGAPWPA